MEKHTVQVKKEDQAERGKSDVFELVVFSIGDVSFVTAPFENGGYEARSCHSLPGSGEEVVNHRVAMLSTLCDARL